MTRIGSIAPTVDIDISKEYFDVAVHPDGETRRCAKHRGGHGALIRRFRPMAIGRILFEATGPCHRVLERRLDMAPQPFVKANPRQARHFAEATGRLAHTKS